MNFLAAYLLYRCFRSVALDHHDESEEGRCIEPRIDADIGREVEAQESHGDRYRSCAYSNCSSDCRSSGSDD